MVSAHEVAAYILKKHGCMTTMKLQKIVYYCQAWSLVWDEERLFEEQIEAWANGPVVRELYDLHRRLFNICKWPRGKPEKLNKKQKDTIGAVLNYYGDKPSQWLSDLTHAEDPWRNTRRDLSSGMRGFEVISDASMAEYYGSLE